MSDDTAHDPTPQGRLTSWAVSLALGLLLSALGWLTSAVQSHIGQISALETRAVQSERAVERIEGKLDRLFDRLEKRK